MTKNVLLAGLAIKSGVQGAWGSPGRCGGEGCLGESRGRLRGRNGSAGCSLTDIFSNKVFVFKSEQPRTESFQSAAASGAEPHGSDVSQRCSTVI